MALFLEIKCVSTRATTYVESASLGTIHRRTLVRGQFIRHREVEFRIIGWTDKPVVTLDHLEALLARVMRAYRFAVGILSE
ncbi:hypothetical protein [Halococcus salsus]|uniref:hypothetical protein n=1 Tax=Halococcus salsus TaxID=2162894 RepID=UPI001356747D|nr:hypothetical protein [Halococcus salsus]